jgi:hypothetical protein
MLWCETDTFLSCLILQLIDRHPVLISGLVRGPYSPSIQDASLVFIFTDARLRLVETRVKALLLDSVSMQGRRVNSLPADARGFISINYAHKSSSTPRHSRLGGQVTGAALLSRTKNKPTITQLLLGSQDDFCSSNLSLPEQARTLQSKRLQARVLCLAERH